MNLPPFPADVPTHPLLVVDYQKLLANDEAEIEKLWEGATSIGFWYLKNHGADAEVEQMFNMGEETMALPLSEKMEFEQGDTGLSFGYKAFGANAVDEHGTVDTAEYINVAQDDIFAWPNIVHRAYPRTVGARMESTIGPFVRMSREINSALLRILERRLGLPDGEFLKRHTAEEHSGSETRCIKSPPRKPGAPDNNVLAPHTDFGSLSFLHNRLGGLQVMPPGTETWQYVKPIPGHAICNLGDAMAILSGGVLKSNLHRVVPPPREQGSYTRWSLVYFTRPGDSVILEPLSSMSEMIAEAASKPENVRFQTGGATARAWFERRVKNQRIKNRKGPETWRECRGTEHNLAPAY